MSSYGELAVHRWMLRDKVRNEAFRRALSHVVKPGDTVLDLGAGTGILSVFAAAAGASKVYAVERTGIAAVARRVIDDNGHASVVDILQSDLEDVSLPGKVDVIVSEWMGGFGVDENILASLVIARDRWLRPGGSIVPGRVTAMLAPASLPDFDDEVAYWRSRPHGVDLSTLASLTTHETFHTQQNMTVDSLIAAPQVMWSHDPYTVSLDEADQPFVANLTFHAARSRSISGFVAWFAADMGDGTTLTNEVGAPDTHWGRTLFPLDRPIAVAEGEAFEVELRCEPSMPGSCEMYWRIELADGRREEHDTRRHRQPHAR